MTVPDPATIAAIAQVTSAAAQGGAQAYGGAQSYKGEKKRAKEQKRKTLADLYNSALQREFDQYRFDSEQGANLAARRASALQEMANNFSRSLLGR